MSGIVSAGETIGGGVNLDQVQEDQEFAALASMSVEDIENLLENAGKQEPEAELTTPESEANKQEPKTPEQHLPDTLSGGNDSLSGGKQDDANLTEDQRLEQELNQMLQSKSSKKDDSPKQEQPQPDQNKQATVPQQALHAARKDGQQAKEQAKTLEEQLLEARTREAYLLGQLEATRQGTLNASQQQPAQPERTVQHVDAEIHQRYQDKEAKLEQLAKDFDNSEFGMVEMRQKERAILAEYNNSIMPLVQERNDLSKPKQNQPTAEEINGDVWLQQNTEALRNDHPWLFDEDIKDGLWQSLTDAAMRRMESRGQVITPTPQSTLALRRTIAEVGEEWGMGERYAQAQNQAPQTVQTGQPQAMPNAEDRISKIRMAEGHPPNISQAGNASIGDDTPSRLEGSTSADLVNQLNTAELERLLKLGA